MTKPKTTQKYDIPDEVLEQLLGRVDDPEELYRTVILPRKLALADKYVDERGPIHDLKTVIRTIWELAARRRAR